LGVVVRARVVLHETEPVTSREGDRRLGEPLRALVLVGVEVSPHGERHSVDRIAPQPAQDPLALVHSCANVVSVMASRSRAARARASVSVASSTGRSRAYADVVASSGSGSTG